MAYGVIPSGFQRKRLPEILADLQAANVATFGPGVVQTDQSPLGQLNGLHADLAASLWELAESVYQALDPDQAEGVNLERIAKLRLLERAAGVQGGEKTIQWSACVCAGAGGVKVGHWIG